MEFTNDNAGEEWETGSRLWAKQEHDVVK